MVYGIRWKILTFPKLTSRARRESAKETMCTGPGAVAAVPLEERLRQSLNQIPAVEKKAYLEALQVQSPSNLIEAESHPLRFLQREDFDCTKAARRLVDYWEERKKAFGEKAFRPLALNSYTKEAIDALKDRVFLHLPDDNEGRPVVYRDDNKIKFISLHARLQLMFFLDCEAKEYPQSATEGVVWVTNVDRIEFDRNTKACRHVALNCFPSKLFSAHIILFELDECGHSEGKMDEVALGFIHRLALQNTHIHIFKTLEDCAESLLPFGLNRLPKFLGGFDQVMPWECFANRQEQETCNLVNEQCNNVTVYAELIKKVLPIVANSHPSNAGVDDCATADVGESSPPGTFPSSTLSTSSAPAPSTTSSSVHDSSALKRQGRHSELETMVVATTQHNGGEEVIFVEPPPNTTSRQFCEQKQREPIITTITDDDVLLWKGRKYAGHSGNLRLQNYIEMHSDGYDEASNRHRQTHWDEDREEMNRIKQEVYDSVSRRMGRFLKPATERGRLFGRSDGGGWYEVSAEVALEKIAMSFRNHRKRKSGNQ